MGEEKPPWLNCPQRAIGNWIKLTMERREEYSIYYPVPNSNPSLKTYIQITLNGQQIIFSETYMYMYVCVYIHIIGGCIRIKLKEPERLFKIITINEDIPWSNRNVDIQIIKS